MDKATRDDIQRFIVVQNPNVSLPTKYAQLIQKFDVLTSDDFDALVDDLIDEIELEEIRPIIDCHFCKHKICTFSSNEDYLGHLR